ncbi:hypothetical protein CBR_g12038 [Chara braunii]|uniref:EF-hand domain-containing protein n=1 Tax=Chara braunii TaxID=69332 RepID=A0A388KQX7_CHABU|nr:hypothetical protein CBR_g12038 [Chara braunii]|eukprot:GBG72464.1 hypothetical protein CBR_g12038 [Chara braunii]
MATETSEAGTPAIAKAAQPEEAEVEAIAGEVEPTAEDRPCTGESPTQAVDASKSSSTVDISCGKSLSRPVSDGEMASGPVTDGGMASGPDTDGQLLGSGGAKAAGPKMERKPSIAKYYVQDLESGSSAVTSDGRQVASSGSGPDTPDGQSSGSGAANARPPRIERKSSIAKLVQDLESGSGPVTSDGESPSGPYATDGQSGSGAEKARRPRMERKPSIAKLVKDLEDKANADKAPPPTGPPTATIGKADRARAVESAIFRGGGGGVAPVRRFRTHLKELMDAFQVFDADRSGMISADELVVLFKSIGIQLTEEETSSMINEVDSNGSGTLEFIEFVRMMESSADGESSIQKKLYEAFQFFDRSGDGRISPQELQDALHKLRGELVPIREVKIMMGKADVDRDGHISFKEFLKLLATSSFDHEQQASG